MTSASVDLRKCTGKIRHLDAARARELVALFRRPIHATGPGFARDCHDPVVAAAYGWASLGRSPGDTAEDVIGHFATHRAGELSLGGITSLTDRVANILASHEDGVLSLRGLERVTAAALAKLRQNPGIELPRRLWLDPAAPSGAATPPWPSEAATIAAIERIAQAGELALSTR